MKAVKSKTITQNGKTKDVIDLGSLNLMNPDIDAQSKIMSSIDLTNHYDAGKVQGFALSCLKTIALKLDTYDANFGALLNRIEALENQLKPSNTAA